MSKNIKITDRTHLRLKRRSSKSGRLIGHMADELLNVAMDIDLEKTKQILSKSLNLHSEAAPEVPAQLQKSCS